MVLLNFNVWLILVKFTQHSLHIQNLTSLFTLYTHILGLEHCHYNFSALCWLWTRQIACVRWNTIHSLYTNNFNWLCVCLHDDLVWVPTCSKNKMFLLFHLETRCLHFFSWVFCTVWYWERLMFVTTGFHCKDLTEPHIIDVNWPVAW